MICNWIGHKYRPRYDYTFPSGMKIDGFTINNLGAEAFQNKAYKIDICERCGSVIRAEKTP